MQDYSDLIFLIAAIAIYGLLVNNTNRTLLLNKQILSDSEIEYGAISVAQDILDAAKWETYSTLSCSQLLTEFNQSEYRDEIFEAGCTIDTPATCPSSSNCKRVNISVESDYLRNADGSRRTINLSMIKTAF